MRKAGYLCVVGFAFAALVAGGCGSGGDSGSTNLDTSAPPPGPNANLNPPTKIKATTKAPVGPTASSGGGGTMAGDANTQH